MLIRSRFWKKVAQHDRIIEDVLYLINKYKTRFLCFFDEQTLNHFFQIILNRIFNHTAVIEETAKWYCAL